MKKKYTKDYRLENVIKNGKVKTVAVYCGDNYRFSDSAAMKHTLPITAAAVIAAAVVWICGLLLNCPLVHISYVIIPFAFCALPIGFIMLSVYGAAKACEHFTREQADNMYDRITVSSVFLMIFSGITLIGAAVALIGKFADVDIWGIVFVLCDAIIIAAAIVAFVHKSAFSCMIDSGSGAKKQ